MKDISTWELLSSPKDDPSHQFYSHMKDHDYLVVTSDEGTFIHEKIGSCESESLKSLSDAMKLLDSGYNINTTTYAKDDKEFWIKSYWFYDYCKKLNHVGYHDGSLHHSSFLSTLVEYINVKGINSITLMVKDEFTKWLSKYKEMNEQWLMMKLDSKKD